MTDADLVSLCTCGYIKSLLRQGTHIASCPVPLVLRLVRAAAEAMRERAALQALRHTDVVSASDGIRALPLPGDACPGCGNTGPQHKMSCRAPK